jgi:cation transport regulator ChaC
MADPMMLDVATIIVRKTVEALADPAKDAVVRLMTTVRNRFRGDKEAETALAVAEAAPDSPAHVEELARVLERLSAADPEFSRDLRTLRNLVRGESTSTAQDDGVINNFTGTAEKVVQLRDVHGNINL